MFVLVCLLLLYNTTNQKQQQQQQQQQEESIIQVKVHYFIGTNFSPSSLSLGYDYNYTHTYLLALRSLLLIISFRLIVDPSLIYLSPSLSFYIFSVQYLIIYNEIVFTPTPTQPQPPSPPITTHTHVCSMRNAYYFDEQNEQNSNNLPNASDEQLASC